MASAIASALDTKRNTGERGGAERSVAQRDLAKSDLATRSTAQPDLAKSDMAKRDLATRSTAQPDLAKSDMAKRDLAEPNVARQYDAACEFDVRYRALRSRDRRFDGRFFVAVTSTGVYCRPICPANVPRRENVRFYPTAAAAQAAGFRACLRCRPHAAPGSPEWNVRGDLAARAVGLIADGLIDREGVNGLARRLSYSERHLHRQLTAELGAGPLALARAQRAQTARMLIETSRLALVDVAHAAGFASVRQFNDTIKTTYGRTPSELRSRASTAPASAPSTTPESAGALTVRLAYRPPLHWEHLLQFLATRAIPGVEEVAGTLYRRTLRLPHGYGIAELIPADGHIGCRLQLADLRDLPAAVGRCRRLLDLDADPLAPAERLAEDPLLAPLVQRHPGLRVPGTVDGPELAVRAVLGQQVSLAAARTAAARLTHALGEPLPTAHGTLTHLFPSSAAIAAADPTSLSGPLARRRTLQTLARALSEGTLAIDSGSDREEVRSQLLAVPGIGAWTTEYIAMRALADPDAFLSTDLGVKHALARLAQVTTAREIDRIAEPWRPWRAYALQHLWASCSPSFNGYA
jgi:AraC family transcriptional regulator of adaptative response / DNA-3-methyladenine glycosylase II